MAITQSETESVRKPFQKGTELTEMELMYAETFKQLEEGSIVEGTVVAVQAEGVVVDIGYKSEGIVPREEFAPEELNAVKVGDRFLVYLEEREDSDGNMILSKEKADRMKIWGDLERISEKGEVIEGKVLNKIKGGMMVDIGIKAFLPGSQIDLRPVRDLDSLIGKTYQMKIIKMNHRRSNVVVSRRVVLEENRDRRKQQAMATLQEGQIIDGQVKNITDYGAFIDLGGIDGLLHITDMSWGRVAHPSELFMVGDRVKVMILKYDRETGRISLGVKQLKPDPWQQVEQKYAVGSRVRGKVVSLVDYGAFVELEPGIEGLVHISEMTWSHEIKHPSKLVAVGDQVEAQVLNVERKGRKISLGMKQVAANPWEVVEAKYPVGSIIEGKVKSLTEFGVFVGLDEGIDGLIHVSDLSWTKRVTHPGDLFKKGQAVKAVVLRVDKDKERLSLGFKQLTPDPWETDIPKRYQVGQDVNGKVVKITDFGAFVECEDGVEGLIHMSEMNLEGQKIEERYKVGDEVTARVIRVDSGERKIALSIREQVGDWGLPEGDEQHAPKKR
ncbi:MAG: 30S ribosomal protein S1 [Nitrospirae bacterium]|nr:30S ribosomal protein S1 [Nitrospirota bacterium]